MTAEKLYQMVIAQFPIKEIHPLHKAIIEECCENAVNEQHHDLETETLIYTVNVSVMSVISTLQASWKGAFEFVDTITLNYRNQTFVIDKNSKLLGK